VSPHVENLDDFASNCDGQSAADTSLALFSARNQYGKASSILGPESNERLHTVSKVFR